MRVLWTDTALGHLEDIFDYFKLKASLATARKIVASIVDKTILLEQTPNMGQREELLRDRKNKYRYLVEGNYKIIYWVDGAKKQINIAAIFDCRQNPTRMKEVK